MSTRDQLVEQLKDKEYRDAFVASQIDIGIPYQIRALRGQMSQGELAARAGMKQPRVSAIERPGYSSLNLSTLKRIAAAFDVALLVRFVPFSELVEWAETFSPDTFSVPEFGKDEGLFKGSALQGYVSVSKGQGQKVPSHIASALGATAVRGASAIGQMRERVTLGLPLGHVYKSARSLSLRA